ncbi:ankyrin repeat protein [Treponema phagedenis F0421]|nr:ankyrin repeat protein [Treponema phagedenis F0421]TYT79551.1 hypothetical protein FS559_10945 [Treponema phagedenis]
MLIVRYYFVILIIKIKAILIQENSIGRLILQRNFHVFLKKLTGIIGSLVLACIIFSCTSTPLPERKQTLFELIQEGNIEGLKERFSKESVNIRDSAGNTLLHAAVKQNNEIIIRFLLSMRANPEDTDSMGRTPLMLAITEDCLEAAKVLAEANANIFAYDGNNDTPFALAARKGSAKYILTAQTVLQQDKDGRTPLHYAAIVLDEELVKDILKEGNPIQKKDKDHNTPLHLVYKKTNHIEAAKIAALLLRAGAEPLHKSFDEFEIAVLKRNYSMRFNSGNTALHMMAKEGFLGFIRYLIAQGVDLNAKNVASSTPLHEAVRNGHADAVQVLLLSGADPNARDASSNTPLHIVMPKEKRIRIFTDLLNAGALPSLKDIYGETPLHIAARVGMDVSIINQLIRAGADVNERNKKGETPLLLAIDRNNIAAATYFVTLGADINAENIDKETPLTKAFDKGLETVKAIITPQNLGGRDSLGRSPLHIAVIKSCNTDILRFLLSEKKQISAGDQMGNTPLHYAVANNDKVAGELLMAEGASIFVANMQGASPLKTALTQVGGREGWILNQKTINAQDSAGNTPLHYAAEWKLVSMMNYIILKGGKIDARNTNAETPLFSAVKSDSADAIRLLLHPETGKSANIDARDFLGNSALHACIRWSSYDAAEALLEEAKLKQIALQNAQNLAGKAPLHDAAEQEQLNFIRLLIEYYAKINIGDETGKSPLADAVIYGRKEAVRMLLENGASPVQQDMYGRTAFHEAVNLGSLAIITEIRTAGGNPLARDSFGTTPLSLALFMGDTFVDTVVGTNPMLANSDGDSPLHIAVAENAKEHTLKLLLNKKYQVNKRNRTGSSALLTAVKNGRKNFCKDLLEAGADPFLTNNAGESPLSIMLSEQTDMIDIFANFAAQKTDVIGDTILHYAARIANAQTVKKLISMNKFNLLERNTAGETPRDVALRWKRSDIAQLLN